MVKENNIGTEWRVVEDKKRNDLKSSRSICNQKVASFCHLWKIKSFIYLHLMWKAHSCIMEYRKVL